MRILYIGGGSGGHLAPLVAVERAVHEADATAESLFVCSAIEDDTAFLKKAGVRYQPLPLPRRPLRHPFALLRSMREAKRMLAAFQPDVIFSKGGIVSIPLCFVAHRKHIPIVLHESDAVMGKANRLIARWATNICLGFPIGGRDVRIARLYTVTGNPVRPDVTHGSRSTGLAITKLSGSRPILLVMGGSQGAQALNDAVTKNIDALLAHCDVIHLTGRGKKTSINKKGYWQSEFIYDELPDIYAVADVALSRAGAGAISELAANGIPMILVPIEGLANDHQVRNAITAQENAECILLLQKNLGGELAQIVVDLLENPERRKQISHNVRRLGREDAAGQIAQILLQCVARERRTH